MKRKAYYTIGSIVGFVLLIYKLVGIFNGTQLITSTDYMIEVPTISQIIRQDMDQARNIISSIAGQVSNSEMDTNAASVSMVDTTSLAPTNENIGGYAPSQEREDSSESVVTNEQQIQQYLDVWDKGTFETVMDSANYHFAKHGEEVGAGSLTEYLEKAYLYREAVLSDVSSYDEEGLKSKYKVTVSMGKLPAHKYKHRNNEQFIIVLDENFNILSYGR